MDEEGTEEMEAGLRLGLSCCTVFIRPAVRKGCARLVLGRTTKTQGALGRQPLGVGPGGLWSPAQGRLSWTVRDAGPEPGFL